uniref:VM domain-containing protein n=1 Tax=Stomoxys calcitrans TaxID=35570 RepID=A0A1I8P6V2_STOCA
MLRFGKVLVFILLLNIFWIHNSQAGYTSEETHENSAATSMLVSSETSKHHRKHTYDNAPPCSAAAGCPLTAPVYLPVPGTPAAPPPSCPNGAGCSPSASARFVQPSDTQPPCPGNGQQCPLTKSTSYGNGIVSPTAPAGYSTFPGYYGTLPETQPPPPSQASFVHGGQVGTYGPPQPAGTYVPPQFLPAASSPPTAATDYKYPSFPGYYPLPSGYPPPPYGYMGHYGTLPETQPPPPSQASFVHGGQVGTYVPPQPAGTYVPPQLLPAASSPPGAATDYKYRTPSQVHFGQPERGYSVLNHSLKTKSDYTEVGSHTGPLQQAGGNGYGSGYGGYMGMYNRPGF